MDTSGRAGADWVAAWIDAQKSGIEKWLATASAASPKRPAWPDLAELLRPGDGAGSPWRAGAEAFTDLWRTLSSAGGVASPFAGMPEVGPLREQQRAAREWTEALERYLQLSVAMLRRIADVQQQALDLLGRRAAELAHLGQPIGDFKGLYDLWIECGEAVYAKVVSGDDYATLQADLCNAAVRVRELEQQQAERWLKQLDLPTRSELNTLHRRVQDLKRQVAGLEARQPVQTAGKSAPARPRAARRGAAKPRAPRRPGGRS